MTVAELIALLQTMPQELPVTVLNEAEHDTGLLPDEACVVDCEWFEPTTEPGDRGYRYGPHVRIG